MADCCLIKKVATVEVYENKNEVRAYGFMAGDRNTPVMEVRFKHLWGESNLSSCKLRWIIVDDLGSLLVGEVPIEQDNTASIQLPNELFNGERRMKVQLTVASCDGSRILNLQQFTDLKVINNLATNEVVEPVYQMLINQVYDDTKKYLAELETSYKAKYGSLESVYAKSKASLEQYLITAENGGNAEFLQGYNPKNFNRVENTINELTNSASSKYKVGDVVEVLGYYTAGDGAHHKRKIEAADDGSGVQLANGLWANIVHNGEVNVSWFGAKGDGVTDDTVAIQKAISIINVVKNIKFLPKTYLVSKSLEFNYSLDTKIIGNNAKIKGEFKDFLIKLKPVNNETWPPPQYITFEDLQLHGEYSCGGVDIYVANLYKFNRVTVWDCTIGFQFRDTYYGELSGDTSIRNCLIGLKFTKGVSSGEINGILFSNIQINFATNKENFVPKNIGESDSDYNDRVESFGIKIDCMIMGCKFYGLTIEGFDYGIQATPYETPSELGVNDSIFSIESCYFEAIKKYNMRFLQTTNHRISWRINIEKNRFFEGTKPIFITAGTYRIFGNQPCNIDVEDSLYRTNLYTDAYYKSINYVKNGNTGIYSTEGSYRGLVDMYKYGLNSEYPDREGSLATFEDTVSSKIITPLRSVPSVITKVNSVTTKPVTFTDFKNTLSLKTSDNKVFGVFIGTNKKLFTKEVNNYSKLTPDVGAKTALELYNNPEFKEGDSFKNIETGYTLTKENGLWYQNDNKCVGIGKGVDIYDKIPERTESWWTPTFYNIETMQLWCWQGSFWGLQSTDDNFIGSNPAFTSLRVCGTTKQRPILNNDTRRYVIYFNTENLTYETFKDGVWKTWDGTIVNWEPYEDVLVNLDTPYRTLKMQQEGVYEDFIQYMDEKTEYDRLQRELEHHHQSAFEQSGMENYEEWIAQQPMLLPVGDEPQPSEKLLAFKEKYLG